MLSQELLHWEMPLVAGGYADQPLGYMNDLRAVRNYLEAVRLRAEERADGDTITTPTPGWAWRLLQAVDEAEVALEDEADAASD